MKTCWFYQRWISWHLDSDQSPPERLRRHLESCPRCRDYWQAERLVVRRLEVEAKTQRLEASPDLQARILAATQREEINPVTLAWQRPTWFRPWQWQRQWQGATATLLLLVSMAWLYFQAARVNTLEEQRDLAEVWRSLVEPIAKHSPAVGSTNWLDWSVAWEKPLKSEMQFVLNDAQAALRGLAENFLPADYRLQLPGN